MRPIRLGFLAIVVLAVAGCADRDERARLGDLVDGERETEVAAVVVEEESPARETTLILAALLATDVGKAITAADQLALERTTQTTLETIPIGTEATWRNPQTGNHGVIAPRKTFQKASGSYCREFTQTLVNGDVMEEALGTACRETDGTWKLADN